MNSTTQQTLKNSLGFINEGRAIEGRRPRQKLFRVHSTERRIPSRTSSDTGTLPFVAPA